MPIKLGSEVVDKTVRFTFSIEESKLREFKKWCIKNGVSAAQVLRLYVEKELSAR